MTAEEIKADKRLQRTYGITLAEYNKMLADQQGGCAICHRPPSHIRLAVDHDHKFDRLKVTVRKADNLWIASCDILGITSRGTDKKCVRKHVKLMLRHKSLRGLLCVNCNRGLQKFYDKPERFEAAAQYLRKFIGLCENYPRP